MRALVVGAGAVGQVFAHHLARAGAHVTFAVRSPEKVTPAQLVRLGLFGQRTTRTVRADAVVRDVEGQRFDLAFVTVPSDALQGEWLSGLVRRLDADIVVGLQPGLEDRARLLALGVPEARFVRGLLSLVSYATPLSPDDPIQSEGYAYWFPPLSPFAFDGPLPLVEAVTSTLRRGGMPAVHKPGLETELVFFTSALLVTIRALERHGWSLDELARDPSLSVAASAQALAVTAHRLGKPVPMGPKLTTLPWLLRLGSALAPSVAPFDVETYARVHFTKVAPQSRLILGDLVRDGRTAGLPVEALENLLAGV